MKKSFSIIVLVLSLIILMIGCKIEKNPNKPVVDLKDLNKKGNNVTASKANEDDKDKLKEFTADIKSNVKYDSILKKELKGYLEINNGKLLKLTKKDDKFKYEVKYKAENELIPDGDEWMYEENHKLNKYRAEVISNLDKEDFVKEVNGSLKYVNGKLLSVEPIEGTKNKWYKYKYAIKYQATRELFMYDEIVGPIAEIINEKPKYQIEVSVDVTGGKTSIIIDSNRDTKSFKDALSQLKEIKVLLLKMEYKQSEEKDGKFVHTIVTEDDKEKALDFLAKYRNFLGDKDTKIIRLPNKDKYEWADVREALWENVLTVNSLEMTDFIQEGDDFIFVYKGVDRDSDFLYSLLKRRVNEDNTENAEDKTGNKDDIKDKTSDKDNIGDKTSDKDKESGNKVEKLNKFNLSVYNKFITDSYAGIFNNFLQQSAEKTLVYSPFSYAKALQGLGSLTPDFDDNPYIGKLINQNMKEGVSNINTDTLVMLNKEYFTTEDKAFRLVSFVKENSKSEAEKASEDLQKRIVGEIMLKPDYKENLASVIINATRFYGKWAKPFDKGNTKVGKFTTMDNKNLDKDIMYDENLIKVGLDNDLVAVGAKRLKSDNDGNALTYFIEAKKWDKESLKTIANNIPKYINEIENFNNEKAETSAKYYDTVTVAVPKLDIESKLELDEIERANGHKSLFGFIRERNTIQRTGKDFSSMQVGKITQVAKMRMDEEEIEAKAVTEIQVDMKAALPEKETCLNIDCTHPHFIVTVSDGVISFIGFVGE